MNAEIFKHNKYQPALKSKGGSYYYSNYLTWQAKAKIKINAIHNIEIASNYFDFKNNSWIMDKNNELMNYIENNLKDIIESFQNSAQ